MVCIAVLFSVFVVSACSEQKDTNIKSIEIIADSVPEVIVVGKFDDAGIKANITYDDNTTAEIDVTTELIPDKYKDLLESPGIYKISIMFRNATTELTVRMVNSTNIYQVNFYDANNRLISTQFVYDGEDAVLPSTQMSAVEGWILTGWDRSNENISKDTNIYGLYVNVENTLSDAKMQQVLLNAEQYYMTNSHFTSIESINTQGAEVWSLKQTINYHYDNEKQLATSQSVYTSDNTRYIIIYRETEAEMLYLSTIEDNEYEIASYEDIESEWDEEKEGESFEQRLAISKLTGGYGNIYTFDELLNFDEVEFSYEITSNKLIYTCTIAYTYNVSDNRISTILYTIKYDEQKVLQMTYKCSTHLDGELCYSISDTYNIDYVEIEFDEDLIPNYGDVNLDGRINTLDITLTKNYLAGIEDLTDKQLVVADANLDGKVDELDVNTIRKYLSTGWGIEYLPYVYTIGDVNLDGVINNCDLSILTKHLEGEEDLIELPSTCADVNLDNRVDEYDLSILFKYVSDWTIELPFTYMLGDVNFDGVINLQDSTIILQYVDGIIELTPVQCIVADVNCDGIIDNFDVEIVRMYVVGGYGVDYLPYTNNNIKELLIKAINSSLNSDITMTQSGKWNDDEGVATTETSYIDIDNYVIKRESDEDMTIYAWESKGALYEAFVDGNERDCYKTTGATFEDEVNAKEIYMFVGDEMLYNGTNGETQYTFASIEVIDGNFAITINASRVDYPEITGTIKYTFNKQYVLSVESTYDYTGTYTYDYSDVDITLPEDIKALESSAIEE